MFQPNSCWVAHAGYLIYILLEKGIPELLEQTSRRFPKRNLKGFEVEDRISVLPDDFLMRILLLVPTKYAVLTSWTNDNQLLLVNKLILKEKKIVIKI